MTAPTSPSYIKRPERRPAPPCEGYNREVYLTEIAIRDIRYGECWCGCEGKTLVSSDTDRSNWKLSARKRVSRRRVKNVGEYGRVEDARLWESWGECGILWES